MSNSNYPKAWSRFTSQTRDANNVVPEELVTNFAQLARWSARFRLAKSFKALDLGDHYSGSDTPQLYSAITRIFLVYSAFETYCRIIGLNPSRESQVKALQDTQALKTINQSIRDLDPKNAFSSFLEKHLCDPNLKQMMHDFIEGQEVNISFLARCTRHVFAHGILTASSPNLSATRFDQVSQVISDFLLNCMDQDFDKRVP
ncbi:MAG: hypothetical protein ACO37W_07755 [Prochlorotrichaceae cyanobacterium]